jgi:malonyl CoA-acyl carrier protein transacylase
MKPGKVRDNAAKPVVMMLFAGQGSQGEGCGKRLYECQSTFKKTVDAIEAEWLPLAGWSLREAMFQCEKPGLDETWKAQPLLFMIQTALYETFKSWGVYADVVCGHSAGELGSIYAGGAYSLQEMTRVAYHRSRLQQSTSGCGRMLYVNKSRAEVEAIFTENGIELGLGQIEVACVNAPSNTVVCGSYEKLQPAIALLKSKEVKAQLIVGDIAFHSSHMGGILKELKDSLGFLDGATKEFEVPVISSVTGGVETCFESDYWCNNVRQPVMFRDAMEYAMDTYKPDIILELSQHITLRSPAQDCFGKDVKATYIYTLIKEEDDAKHFARALGDLWQNGVTIDMQSNIPRPPPVSQDLPTYPFQLQVTKDINNDGPFFKKKPHWHSGPLIGKVLCESPKIWMTLMDKPTYPWMAQHIVQNVPIVPAAGYIEMICEAAGKTPCCLKDVAILHSCPIADAPRHLHVQFDEVVGDPNTFNFQIRSVALSDRAAATIHCVGAITVDEVPLDPKVPASIPVERTENYSEQLFDSKENFYEQLLGTYGGNFQYEGVFQINHDIWADPDSKGLWMKLTMDEKLFEGAKKMGYVLHPTIIDGGLQSFLPWLMRSADIFAIPSSYKTFHVLNELTSNELICIFSRDGTIHNRMGQLDFELGEHMSGHLALYDARDGSLLAYMREYRGHYSNNTRPEIPNSKYEAVWQPKAAVKLAPHAMKEDVPLHAWCAELCAAVLSTEVPKRRSGAEVRRFCRVLDVLPTGVEGEGLLDTVLPEFTKAGVRAELVLTHPDSERLQEVFDKYKDQPISLRAAPFDPMQPSPQNGVIRPASVDLAFVHMPEAAEGAEDPTKAFVAAFLPMILPGGRLVVLRPGQKPEILEAPAALPQPAPGRRPRRRTSPRRPNRQ